MHKGRPLKSGRPFVVRLCQEGGGRVARRSSGAVPREAGWCRGFSSSGRGLRRCRVTKTASGWPKTSIAKSGGRGGMVAGGRKRTPAPTAVLRANGSAGKRPGDVDASSGWTHYQFYKSLHDRAFWPGWGEIRDMVAARPVIARHAATRLAAPGIILHDRTGSTF